MLQLCFVRHGQTDFSRENRFCGAIDPPLNAVGVRMADAWGAAAAIHGADAIYTSPRGRARQTADALATRIGLEPKLKADLAEIAYGEWESLRPEEAAARDAEAYAWWTADNASRAPPGGETAFQVAARATPVIERIRADHPDGRVWVVSHKATIRILVCALLGLDVRLFRQRIAQPVAAVTRFDISPAGAMLVELGNVSHLPPDLIGIEGT